MLTYEKTAGLAESLKEYTGTLISLNKLEAIERTSSMGASLVSILIIGLLSAFFILFVSLSLGFYLSAVIGISYAGFAIVAAAYLSAICVIIAVRRKYIERPIRDRIILKVSGDDE